MQMVCVLMSAAVMQASSRILWIQLGFTADQMKLLLRRYSLSPVKQELIQDNGFF